MDARHGTAQPKSDNPGGGYSPSGTRWGGGGGFTSRTNGLHVRAFWRRPASHCVRVRALSRSARACARARGSRVEGVSIVVGHKDRSELHGHDGREYKRINVGL